MKLFRILTLILSLKINVILGIPTFTDKIVAIVNDDIICHSDITNKIHIMKYDAFDHNVDITQNNRLYYTVLDQLITDRLILQIAIKENIKTDSNQLNKIIDSAAHIQNMTIDQFYIYLNHIGLNKHKYLSEIRQEILKKFICNQMIYKYNNISPNEVKNMTQKLNFINFRKRYKLTHIIIELPIQTSFSKKYQSEKFAKLLIQAKKNHQNIQKFINSYYYDNNNIFPRITIKNTGWITWEQIPIIFDQYLKTAKPQDIIGPILSHDGVHILEIEDIYTNENVLPIFRVQINDIVSKSKTNNVHIKQKLLTIKKQIENEDYTFNIILQENSKDFYSKNYGNFLKWINLNQFDLSIQKKLLNLKKNQISTPLYINNRWCLIKLINIDELNYSQMIYERAYSHILHQKFDENLHNWLQELKSKSYIQIIN